MLVQLRVRDFALVEDVTLHWGERLTILTGETGAGKSIVVDSLETLLGGRAGVEKVRSGAPAAQLEALFLVPPHRGDLRAICEGAGVPWEDGSLVLRREIPRQGPSRAYANGVLVPGTLLRALGEGLVDFHGQHEHQSLLRPAQQLEILDAYAGAMDERREVGRLYERVRALQEEATALRERARDLAARREILAHQVAEIDRTRLRPEEEEDLRREAEVLAHAEELRALAGIVFDTLYGAEDSVLVLLARVRRSLEEMSRRDPRWAEGALASESARAQIEDLAAQVRTYREDLSGDPERLEALRARLDLIARLRRRYSGTIAEILAHREEAARELAGLEGVSGRLESLSREQAGIEGELQRRARDLSQARRKAARRLAREVGERLRGLGLAQGHFEISLRPEPLPAEGTLEGVGRTGWDQVEFLIAPNPGETLRPLARIASGGELARVMLALKTSLAEVDRIPTLVFDEIDAGIGGRVAHNVGARLAEVAQRHQVLVVSHLPQIAVRAEDHWTVVKRVTGERTTISAHAVRGEERVREIARMLGGDPDSATSRRHARELLKGARPVGPEEGPAGG